MADRSGIEWTEATWNPTTGCTKVNVRRNVRRQGVHGVPA